MLQGEIGGWVYAGGRRQADAGYIRAMAEVLMEAIGQEALTERLACHAEEGSLAHAMLLTGAPGRGGLALALALARRLHCTASAASTKPCGSCPSCLQHDQLQHPDLHFTFPVAKPAGKDKALSSDQLDVWRQTVLELGPHFDMQDLRERMSLGNKQPFISVHEATDILRRLSLTAHAGGWKIQIIWGAHMMRVDTANKLLKLLEEPPKKTLFILLADNTEALLATILSRTQILTIPPIPADRIFDRLKVEGGEAEATQDAVDLCEGDLAQARRLIQRDSAEEFTMFIEWMRTCFARDGRKAAGIADQFHDLGRESQKAFLAYALHLVRQCIVGNYGAASAVRLRAAERAFAEKFAPFIHHGNVHDMQSGLERAAREVAGNVYGLTVFLDLSMRMMELLHRPQ